MDSSVDTSVTKSYLDFSGLGTLRGQAAQNGDKAINEASQQFEGLFIQMMLQSMREATQKDESNQSSGRDMFENMFDKEVSVQMAKRNATGLSSYITKAVQQHSGTPQSTAAFLQARGKDAIPLHPDQAAIPLKNDAAPAISLPKKIDAYPLPKSFKGMDGGNL